MWDFDEEARRIRDVVPGLPIRAAQSEDIIATCRDLDRQDRADALIQLTLKEVRPSWPRDEQLSARIEKGSRPRRLHLQHLLVHWLGTRVLRKPIDPVSAV